MKPTVTYIHRPDVAGNFFGKYRNLPFVGMSIGYQWEVEPATADTAERVRVRATAAYCSARKDSYSKVHARKELFGRLTAKPERVNKQRVKEFYVDGGRPTTAEEWDKFEELIQSKFV